jgi:alternate F1F0 ATPase F1 subunit epsilon
MTLGAEDEEQFVALDHGTLVKEADTVRISVRRAVVGESLETLAKTVKETFKKIEEREKTARAAGMKLEASFAREMTKSNR